MAGLPRAAMFSGQAFKLLNRHDQEAERAELRKLIAEHGGKVLHHDEDLKHEAANIPGTLGSAVIYLAISPIVDPSSPDGSEARCCVLPLLPCILKCVYHVVHAILYFENSNSRST